MKYGENAGASRDIRKEFVSASPTRRRAMIRMGFEAETQATDGKGSGDGSILSREAATNFFGKYWLTFLRREAIDLPSFAAENFEVSWLHSAEHLWEKVKEMAIKCLVDGAIDEDLSTGELPAWLRNKYLALTSPIPGLECGEDGSVRGFEFRTVGPQTFPACARLAKKFFDGHEHDIDTRCSWHVHISLPGVKHQYGPKFQGALIAAVLNRIERVPDSVLERWNDGAAWRYFPVTTGSTRAFVAFNSEFGTWEFRCWGNIQNAEDGIRCFELTVEALHEAYADAAACPSQESFSKMVDVELLRRSGTVGRRA